MLSRTGLCALCIALLAAAIVAAPAAAAPAVDGEFSVSGLGTDNKLVEGPDGNIWVTLDDLANEVARIGPAGEVAEYDLAGIASPSGITADGAKLWITHEEGVTSFLPGDPEGSAETTAIAAIDEFHSIVDGPDGNLWVATVDDLIRVPPDDPGDFEEFPVAGLSPRDIDVVGSGLAIANSNGPILRATTAGVTTSVPTATNSEGLAGGPGGLIGFSRPLNEIGLLAPAFAPRMTQVIGADPIGAAFGTDEAFWFALFATDSLARLTPSGELDTLGGFAADSGPRQIAPGPDNTLWVTLENADEVARVSGVVKPPDREPVCFCGVVKSLRTRIAKGPKRKVKIRGRRALVRFQFKSPDPGAKFECSLKRIPKGGRTVKPRFRACKPPRIYALGTGKYRFWVRAVRGDELDRTPAKHTFFIIRKR